MKDCKKCGYCSESEQEKEYIYKDVCLSKSFIAPIKLHKDLFGKFIPHKDCPFKKHKTPTGKKRVDIVQQICNDLSSEP